MPIINKGGRRGSLDSHFYNNTSRFPKRSITDFLSHEYRDFCAYAVQSRCCPSVCDGLKISGRKVMYSAFVGPTKSGEKVKFLSLSGTVFEKTLYPHGDSGLHVAMFSRGEEYSDNLYGLDILGQHGTLRCPNAKSSPRYLSVKLSKYASLLKEDWDLLNYVEDEGQTLEPTMFYPILPMTIVSVQQGLAPGYRFLNPLPMNPLSVIDMAIDIIKGKEPKKPHLLKPYVRGIKTESFSYSEKSGRWSSRGNYTVDLKNNVLKITDLPFGVTYKMFEEALNELADSGKIRDWKNFSQDGNIDYRVSFPPGKLQALSKEENLSELENMFLLTRVVEKPILNVLSENNKLMFFETPEDLERYFVKWRLTIYNRRKTQMINVLNKKFADNDAICRFIALVNSGKIKIQNRKKSDVKVDLDKEKLPHSVLSVEISKLTDEEKEELLKKNMEIQSEIEYVKATTIEDMYINDLKKLRKELSKDFPEP